MRIHWDSGVREPLDAEIIDSRDTVETDCIGHRHDVHQTKVRLASGTELVVSVATRKEEPHTNETVVFEKVNNKWVFKARMARKFTVPVAIKRAFPFGVE